MNELGSIRLVGYGQMNKKEYILFSKDIDKLNLIENAGNDSKAFCIDTSQLFIKHDTIWHEVKLNE